MRKLGRLPRKHDSRIPCLSQFFTPAVQLTPPPISCDWSAGMPDDLGMMLNDQLGDCTCAAFYHARQVWNYNAAKQAITDPDSDVLKMYEEATGYTPANPLSDQGGIEQDVLQYLLNTGAPVGPDGSQRDKILAYLEIDFRNLDDLKRAIHECGVAYIGVDLPQSVMDNADDQTKPWDVAGDKTIAGGHAVVLVGYDLDSFTCISWGQRYKISVAFMGAFLQEAYAIAAPDWIEATGSTPLNLSVEQLEQAMKHLKE